MRVFLSGVMGSGKSTVARVLAAKLGVAAFDLDALIAQAAGSSVEEIFRTRGEPAFRALERETMRAALAQNREGVFALGGGTVTDSTLRRELLQQGILITLRADIAELARRVRDGSGRPLLAGGDVVGRLGELLQLRADAYAECHGTIESGQGSAEDVAQAALALIARAPVVVPSGSRTYCVEVGSGVRALLPERVAAMTRSPGVALVTDEVVLPLWGEPLAASLTAAGKRVQTVVLESGEAHKTLASVERIWDAALTAGVDRSGGVISVGGGVAGDLAGFAGSTLLRGVAVGHVPTTLLAMVDSAIGGKTGFDTRHGKNLVGSFHQPRFVLCDVDVLSTLPLAERRAGLAEVVKSAFIESEQAVQALERDQAALIAGDVAATVRAIRMSASMKARIVSEDEREAGLRALLNLGHTVGHAIEAAQSYSGLRHGEAVALGMVAAFGLSAQLGVGSFEQRDRLVRLLSGLGLPTDVRPFLTSDVLAFMASDKKRRAAQVTFVLPAEPGRLELRPLPLDELPKLLTAAA